MHANEVLDRSPSRREQRHLLVDAQVTRSRQHKPADSVPYPALPFDRSISNPLVTGDDDQTTSPDDLEPCLIGRTAGNVGKIGMSGIDDTLVDFRQTARQQQIVLVDEPTGFGHAAYA